MRSAQGENHFCGVSDLCPTPFCHVGLPKTEPLAQANNALIDIQLNRDATHGGAGKQARLPALEWSALLGWLGWSGNGGC